MSLLDKFAWECITEVARNPDWIRSRIAELRAEVKPLIDVNSVAATIAAIDAQMANLFALAQHASSQKTIDSLGLKIEERRSAVRALGVLHLSIW